MKQTDFSPEQYFFRGFSLMALLLLEISPPTVRAGAGQIKK